MIVTISRQAGSGGEEIARTLAERKGLRIFDKKILKDKLSRFDIPEPMITKYDEKKPGAWSSFTETREKYLYFMKKAILDFAVEGDCVMLGRGTQILFSKIPGVVKVRITAPVEQRIRQFAEENGYTRKEAEKIIRHINNEREGFYKSFFHKELDSPILYDLVINTEFLNADDSVRLIEDAMEIKKDYNCNLDDLIIEQNVTEKLLYIENVPIQDYDITVRSGAVSISGNIFTEVSAEECKAMAMEISGVTEVNTDHLHTNVLTSHYRL